jgi:hypothetical protein
MSRSDTVSGSGAKEADVTYKVNDVSKQGLNPETKPTEVRMTESIATGSNCSSGCTNKSSPADYKAAQFVDANTVGGWGDRTSQTTQHYFIGDSKSPATLLREIPGTEGRYDMGTAVQVTSTRTSVEVKLEP